MSKTIFITGAVKSGKSSLAVELAQKSGREVVFLATCEPLDEEMHQRVKKHQDDRPSHWGTLEEEIDIVSVLDGIGDNKIVILDCITLWLTNLLMKDLSDTEIYSEVDRLIDCIGSLNPNITLIIVSNEVGWGIVPENKMARLFRDIVGISHQKIAAVSDEVYMTVAGIKMKIKG